MVVTLSASATLPEVLAVLRSEGATHYAAGDALVRAWRPNNNGHGGYAEALAHAPIPARPQWTITHDWRSRWVDELPEEARPMGGPPVCDWCLGAVGEVPHASGLFLCPVCAEG